MLKIKIFSKIKKRFTSFMGRRPHRSFRQTRRRDYVRSLKLPGYISFTKYVCRTIWTNRKMFTVLILIYALVTVLMVGIVSQDLYATLTETLGKTSEGFLVGFGGEIEKAGLLFLTALTGGMSQTLTDVQQIYAGIISLLAWLTSVWMLRNILAGYKVKARDGLYNAGAPILSTFLVALLLVIQLLPLALALTAYSAAALTGILNGGVEAMLFWIAAGLLVMLSLYWVTSTIIALVIVTLPGMYPFQAIKTAGDLVVGRRLRILLRFLWMGLITIFVWAIIMIPVIMFDGWIKTVWTTINWLPIVPVVLLVMAAMTIIWVSSYVYLFYRKVVADDASPA
jgi:hypothetical protein